MRKARVASIMLGAMALAAVALWHTRPRVWPDAGVRLIAPSVEAPASFGKRRVAIDPGHGARDNTGNRSAFCVDEQDFTLALGESVRAELEQSGHFEVRLTREPGRIVEYADRVRSAEACGAEAIVSLHSDVRGRAEPWQPISGKDCPRSRRAPGFAVLFSDEGNPELVARRRELARALAHRLHETRLLPYSGEAYAGEYVAEPNAQGAFLDRRAPGERIYVLNHPRIASVLIETHNALDDREALRWEEPETRRAFAIALAAALIAALGESHAAEQHARL